MSEKTPIVTHETQPDAKQETNDTYSVPDRDTLLGEFARKRQQYGDELEQLEAIPSFDRVHEESNEITDIKDDLDGLRTEWVHYGGEAIDAAQAKVDALNFKSEAKHHVQAKAELRDAKNAFYENFKREFEESNTANEESSSQGDASESSVTEPSSEPSVEVAQEGERLTDYLEAIRKAQENNDELLEKVLLKAYKEILESKSADAEWVARHMSIAETSKNNSVEKDTTVTGDKYKAQFREAVNEVLNRDEEAKSQASEKTEAEKLADQAREVAKEAKDNVDARGRNATPPITVNQEQQTTDKVESNPKEEIEPKKRSRIRKLAKHTLGLLARPIAKRKQAKQEFNAKVEARKTELLTARKKEFEEGNRENPSGWLASLDARDQVRREQRAEKTPSVLSQATEKLKARAEERYAARGEGDTTTPKGFMDVFKTNKKKALAEHEEKKRQTPETKPMPVPTEEDPKPVTNLDINGANSVESPYDVNTTQSVDRPENDEGEQKAA